MTTTIATRVTAAFIALLPLGALVLPWHVQAGDLLFPIAVAAALAAGWRPRFEAVDAFVLLFVAGAAASIPSSLDRRLSAIAVAKDAYGAALYLFVAMTASEIGAARVTRWLLYGIVAVAAVSLAGAALFVATGYAWLPIGEVMPLPYIGSVLRLRGFLFAPEYFGNWLTFAIPLAWWAARDRFAVPVLILAEILTFSKSLGGFALAAVVGGWRTLGRARPIRALALGAAVVLVVALNVAATVTVREVAWSFGKNDRIPPPPYIYARQDPSGADMLDLRVSYNPMSYYLVKKAEWVAFSRSPLTGIGLGTFPLEAERAYQEGRLTQAYRRIETHSTPLGRLAETGIVGAAAWLLLVIAFAPVALRAARGTADAGLGLAIAAALLGILVNSVNVDVMHFRFVWFGLALVRVLAR